MPDPSVTQALPAPDSTHHWVPETTCHHVEVGDGGGGEGDGGGGEGDGGGGGKGGANCEAHTVNPARVTEPSVRQYMVDPAVMNTPRGPLDEYLVEPIRR